MKVKKKTATMAHTILELLAYDNPVLRNYAFWSSILVIKMLVMSLLTAAQRVRTKVISKICNSR